MQRFDTPRLHLRPLAAADAEALLCLHPDPQVMRCRSTPPWAGIDPRNTASAKSLARLGFRPEGFPRERWIVDSEVSHTA